MAFILKPDKQELIPKIAQAIHKTLEKSRFTCDIVTESNKIRFKTIRLKVKKDYCGNHAGPCRLTGQKHRKLNYLEGADWVAFNDMLNDALDKLKISANIASSVSTIRKGNLRRIEYLSGGHGDFLKEGIYANRIGVKSVTSYYPPGTPGISNWRSK